MKIESLRQTRTGQTDEQTKIVTSLIFMYILVLIMNSMLLTTMVECMKMEAGMV